MRKPNRIVVMTLAFVLCVAVAAALAYWTTDGRPGGQAGGTAGGRPEGAGRPGATPSRSPTVAPPTNRAPQPPVSSVHLPDQQLAVNRGVRVNWETVLAAGRPLPSIDRRCTRAWQASGKDRELDWSRARYRCLDQLKGLGYKPQGVAGSGTVQGYRIGGRAAAQRNLVLTSWYSRADERGLVAPNRPGQSVTRLVVMDLDRGRYTTVELVRADAAGRFRNLNSHGSGLAWAGQYLYSSSRSALWMYNADDIVAVGGRFVLPAVARWSVNGSGGLSSISIDRTTHPARLAAINYTKTDRAYLQSFALAPGGLLATTTGPGRPGELRLANVFGEGGRVVSSAASVTVDGVSFQGVATNDRHVLANSSALPLDGAGPADATVVLERGEVRRRIRMPRGNVQSIYLDPGRGTFTTVTEYGKQFLLTVPLRELTGH